MNLENIEAGDKVLVHNSTFVAIGIVERATERFVIVDGKKYRKSDGYISGAIRKYDSAYLTRYDEEAAKWYDKANICQELSWFNWNSLPYEQLKEIYEKYINNDSKDDNIYCEMEI